MRNFSRDDKIISSNGKEVRYPFLTKSLISFTSQVDIKFLLGFQNKNCIINNDDSLENAIFNIAQKSEDFLNPKKSNYFYNKLILRHIAFKNKLENIAMLKKKAIQFGTGLSKKMNKGIMILNKRIIWK